MAGPPPRRIGSGFNSNSEVATGGGVDKPCRSAPVPGRSKTAFVQAMEHFPTARPPHLAGPGRPHSANAETQCRSSGFYPVFCFYPASARYFRVAAGRSCQIFTAISIPISANGIRKYGQ